MGEKIIPLFGKMESGVKDPLEKIIQEKMRIKEEMDLLGLFKQVRSPARRKMLMDTAKMFATLDMLESEEKHR